MSIEGFDAGATAKKDAPALIIDIKFLFDLAVRHDGTGFLSDGRRGGHHGFHSLPCGSEPRKEKEQ